MLRSYTQFVLLLRVWDAILGLCLIQNKTKQNRTQSQNGLTGRVLRPSWASGLPSLLAVGRAEEGEGEEERDLGGGWFPELNFEGGGGEASLRICLIGHQPLGEQAEMGWVFFLRSKKKDFTTYPLPKGPECC